MRRAAPVGHVEVGLAIETIAEVEGRGEIGHRPGRVHGYAKILLDEMRTLWLDGHADVHIEFFSDIAQLHVDVVLSFRTLRIAAEVLGKIALVGVVQVAKEPCPVTVLSQYVHECFIGIVGEVISQRVALLVVVAETVVGLQEQSLETTLSTTSSAVAERTSSGSSSKSSRLSWHAFFYHLGLRLDD